MVINDPFYSYYIFLSNYIPACSFSSKLYRIYKYYNNLLYPITYLFMMLFNYRVYYNKIGLFLFVALFFGFSFKYNVLKITTAKLTFTLKKYTDR